MVAPREGVRTGLLLLALGLSTGALGCAGASSPPTSPSEAPPQPASAPPEPAAPPVTPEASPAPAPAPTAEPAQRDSKVIVVEPGGGEGEMTLGEAARVERERKAHARPPVAVITNKTLPRSTGQVTVAPAKPEKESAPGEASAAADLQNEQYWRERGLEIRTRWNRAEEEIKELERSAADLRRRFYAEDDPYLRDGQIKPEWDRVLDRLRETRVESEKAREDLTKFLEEGRRANALPGWLREGMELEPAIAKKEPTEPESIEPPVIDQDIEEDGV